jgi:hypothetical protein
MCKLAQPTSKLFQNCRTSNLGWAKTSLVGDCKLVAKINTVASCMHVFRFMNFCLVRAVFATVLAGYPLSSLYKPQETAGNTARQVSALHMSQELGAVPLVDLLTAASAYAVTHAFISV